MRHLAVLGLAGLFVAIAAAGASAEVRLSIQDGRVTLFARDVTVRDILAEWARIGHTKIVNAERIPGGPVTLELVDIPEREALEVILRGISGYLAAPRAGNAASWSVYDRILIMPTSVAPAPAPSTLPPPAALQPSFVPQQQPAAADDSDEERPLPTPGERRGRPIFIPPPDGAAQPQPQPPGAPVKPAQAPAPFTPYPGAPTTATPAGVAAPGMLVPTPQVVQPGTGATSQPQR
jgi:hypothetical protein